jgi:phenylacetate-CoA ligase
LDPLLIAQVLLRRQRLRRQEAWSAEQLRQFRQRALASLRHFASLHSPFYASHHRGLAEAPLSELPPLTKATLMARFDEVTTQPSVRLASLQKYLASGAEAPFEGKFWVSSTSGSSGLKAVVPSTRSEWSTIIASYARASDWSGGRLQVSKRSSMAVVSSTTPWHQSSRVATSVKSPFVASTRYDATAPLSELVSALNAQQPDVLVGYASMLGILAAQQLAGRLHIAPRAINVSSEVFTPQARELVRQAFTVQPFEVYAATETGGIAAECARHEGLHLFEDLVIVESVDDQYRAVPHGEPGTRTLVTVLHARTIPLIRYELTDRVRLATRTCSCGFPFALIESAEGRSDDVLVLPGRAGEDVAVHPVVFEQVLDVAAPAGWQVRAASGVLRITVVHDKVPGGLLARVRSALTRVGVTPNLAVEVEAATQTLPGASGKRPRMSPGLSAQVLRRVLQGRQGVRKIFARCTGFSRHMPMARSLQESVP